MNPRPLGYFAIESPRPEAFAQLFECQDDGTLKFAFAAKSTSPCEMANLENGVDFRDYILEGFVQYQIRLMEATFGSVLAIGVYDDNRADAIIPSLKHFCRARDVAIIEMEMGEKPPKPFP